MQFSLRGHNIQYNHYYSLLLRQRSCWAFFHVYVLDLRNKESFHAAHPPHHFQDSSKTNEGVICTSSLPHTLLQQALLRLVGLRMEHGDRQKQFSAPPCSTVSLLWEHEKTAMRRTIDKAIDQLWVNKISVGETASHIVLARQHRCRKCAKERGGTACDIYCTTITCCTQWLTSLLFSLVIQFCWLCRVAFGYNYTWMVDINLLTSWIT